MLKKGSIIICSLPQWNGKEKDRPALLLCQMPGHGDWLACGISSKLYHEVAGFDEKISEDDLEFSKTGLKTASLIRLGFLATMPDDKIKGAIGSLSSERVQRLSKNLSNHILQNK